MRGPTWCLLSSDTLGSFRVYHDDRREKRPLGRTTFEKCPRKNNK